MKSFPFLITILLLCYSAKAMEVWLYSRGSNAKFTIDTVQRCYTLEELWNDRAVRTTWKKLPEGAHLVFYKHAGCVAPSVKMDRYTSGSFSFKKEDKLYLTVSSFMVQELSEYPTEGLVEIESDDPGSIFENTAPNISSGIPGIW
ncbi:hypothetical protein GN958_ATG19947 [Phytophthora infestans]|uniref:Secreted RxLR effector peptide protein n=1 Tax=Phytophthora infestans TaxID=4787 RepID=A0A8S9TTS7_PHYIN|nr:hypothetical protein GN958_ATG19947 [Phytophthora infestans]KAI9981586.1 hypothetical protein PInf_009342 [Phytophthora infestans]